MAQLTAASARRLKRPGRYSAGGGLYLLVKPTGARSWILRVKVGSTRIDRGLGSLDSVSLAEARRKAETMRVELRRSGPRRRPRPTTAGSTTPTFREAAEALHRQLSETWRSESHARQWWQAMESHVFPAIGGVPLDEISRQDCLRFLNAVWKEWPSVGPRLRQRVAQVFRWGMAWGYVDSNPAGEGISAGLPKSRALINGHFRALDYNEVSQALAKVQAGGSRFVTRLAIEFTVLTAARSGEVRGMTWGELSPDGTVWHLPGSRTKSGRDHRVPLSLQAQQLLLKVQRVAAPFTVNGRWLTYHAPAPDSLVFPGNQGHQLNVATLVKLLRTAGVPSSVHGFRSSFRTWTLEQTDTPWAVAEAALAHAIGDATEQAYARSDLFERRRTLMQSWSDFAAPTDDRTPPDPPPGHEHRVSF